MYISTYTRGITTPFSIGFSTSQTGAVSAETGRLEVLRGARGRCSADRGGEAGEAAAQSGECPQLHTHTH